MLTDNLNLYQAAASFLIQAEIGYLRLSGVDRVAFLQRQTTHDVRLLAPGRAVLTVLTSPTARIQDVFYLLQEQQDSIAILNLPGKSASTFRYLKSRIFFMDKVTLSDHSQEYIQLDLLGPQSNIVLSGLGLAKAPAINELVCLPFGSTSLRIIGLEPAFGLGYRLVFPAQHFADVQAVLHSLAVTQIDPLTYEILRIEAGIPAVGHELIEDYTPLEAGLRAAISGEKGCYTGQEIIARQITYDKVTQNLSGLRLSGPSGAGAAVWADDRPAGVVTSYAHSPRAGHIALAILKRPHHQPGVSVIVKDEEHTLDAMVTQLPFISPGR